MTDASVGEPHRGRRALLAAAGAVALFITVVLQLTVVNRLPLPGAAAPDLVLLLVTAIAVSSTPLVGALTGFAGGLAVDIAPPAAHYAGEYALVFCLAGWGAARTVRALYDVYGERSQVTSFTVMAAAAAAGEAGKAALGLLLTEPDVTAAAVSRVLPVAILYDLVLAPLVFWLVTLVTRAVLQRSDERVVDLALGFRREHRLTPVFGNAGSGQVVFRQASLTVPRLPLAGSGQDFTAGAQPRRALKLRLSGSGTNYAAQSPARRDRVPKLRLSGSGTNYGGQPPARRDRVRQPRFGAIGQSPVIRTGAAYSPNAPHSLRGRRPAKLNFAGDLQARLAAPSRTRSPGKNWLRRASTMMPQAKRIPSEPSSGWLRASGPSGGGASGRPGAVPRGFAASAPGSASPLAARQARSPAEALAARSAPSGLSALSGAGTPLARGSGARGWGARGWGARGLGARGRGGHGRDARGWGGARSRGRGPQAGWLSAHSITSSWAPGRLRSPRRGWLGYTGRASRTVLGSTVYRAGATAHGPKTIKASAFRGHGHPNHGHPSHGHPNHGHVRGNWYTASPSGEWLRRSRNPWRKRRERLLRMVGVGR